jgi:AraC-like DNA-binding protein
MSNFRQANEGVLVRSFGLTFSQRTFSPPTSESWDQLVYAIKGVVTVKTSEGAWVAPSHRAVWLPANMRYSLAMSGQTALRMIYLPRSDKGAGGFDRRACAVVSIAPLLRELILRTCEIGALIAGSEHHRRLAGLIEDEIQTIDTVPLQLPYPQTSVVRDLADRFDADVSVKLTPALRECGTSKRTAERLFKAETGLSLGQWIRRRKLLESLERLAAGETISSVAFTLGYNTPSAFIAMFKRELGSPPGEYLARG